MRGEQGTTRRLLRQGAEELGPRKEAKADLRPSPAGTLPTYM